MRLSVSSLARALDTFNILSTNAATNTTLNTDAGADIINVQTISGATTINAGNDSDTINVGSHAQGSSVTPGNNSAARSMGLPRC